MLKEGKHIREKSETEVEFSTRLLSGLITEHMVNVNEGAETQPGSAEPKLCI